MFFFFCCHTSNQSRSEKVGFPVVCVSIPCFFEQKPAPNRYRKIISKSDPVPLQQEVTSLLKIPSRQKKRSWGKGWEAIKKIIIA